MTNEKIEVSSHSGGRQKFGEYFVRTGKFDRDLAKHFTELSEKRHKGDYNDFFDYDEETVLRLFPYSERLVGEVKKLLNE